MSHIISLITFCVLPSKVAYHTGLLQGNKSQCHRYLSILLMIALLESVTNACDFETILYYWLLILEGLIFLRADKDITLYYLFT